MTVNPNAPNVLGHEVMVLRQRGLKFTKDLRRAAISTLPATLTDDIAVRLSNVVGNPSVVAEIIPVSSITPANAVLTTDTYRPSADQAMSGAQHAGGGTVAPFYVDIDEAVLDTSDYIRNGAAGGANTFGWNVASGAFGSERRVMAVTLHLVVQALTQFTYLQPFLYQGAKTYIPSSSVTAATATQAQLDIAMTTNPVTGLPWQQSEIVAFASTSYFGIDFNNNTIGDFRLFQAWITVDSVTETRLAAGSAPASADGWLTIPMATPANVDTWTPAGVQYAIILSCADNGSASWNAVDAGVAHPDISSAPVMISSAGFPQALGTTDTAAPAVVGVDDAGIAVWGQPESLVVEEAIYTGRTVEQEITSTGTQDRGSIGVVVRQQSSLTSAALTLRLKRRSDGVQVGGDVTVQPINVRGAPRIPQVVRLPMAAKATPITAQQYVVELSSTAAAGAGWLLITLSTEDTMTQRLTVADQSVEASIGSWTSTVGGGTITRVNANAHAGAWSIQMTRNGGAGTGTVQASTGIGAAGFPATVGSIYSAFGWVIDNGVNHVTAQLMVSFFDVSNALISDVVVGSVITSGTYQRLSGSAVAPAGTVRAAVRLTLLTVAAGIGTWNIDDFAVYKSTMGRAGISYGGFNDVATIAGVETPDREIPMALGLARNPVTALAAVAV